MDSGMLADIEAVQVKAEGFDPPQQRVKQRRASRSPSAGDEALPDQHAGRCEGGGTGIGIAMVRLRQGKAQAVQDAAGKAAVRLALRDDIALLLCQGQGGLDTAAAPPPAAGRPAPGRPKG